ncbi:MAG: Ada metal-binding domain-containing protein [Halobacteriota archaeon]
MAATTAKSTVSASPSPTPTPTLSPTVPLGSFVGSVNSNVYHYPSCYEAAKIKPENLITFNSVAEACVANYRPCKVCNPPPCQATPTPTPIPQCTHVDIIIYHNMSLPCNTCSMTHGMLDDYYRGNPYVNVVLQNAPGVNGSSNLMVGVVRETGQTTTFAWGDVRGIEAWTDSHLTCK